MTGIIMIFVKYWNWAAQGSGSSSLESFGSECWGCSASRRLQGDLTAAFQYLKY